ncbi:hypothetical protein IQ260_15260 [Leptolyngbya cf. ectocarpi LEGE 11479]|uniref:Uncharacterized protein n=1 Tax=Leptolyngbya cf. ectocarpi LEGE 11479 TaxID=1828722 RepID=A0A928ZV36_LEPEC|nr:hypothetical protein [Leptolyngbya ectocarpi]MBE9068008.1 hypothetical protein [Leptolyngbya cf. ectocarpi LEGE 11479]
MTSQNNSSAPRSLKDIVYQFLLGAVLGLIVSLIPWVLIEPGLTVWNLAVTSIIILLCGILSALLGKQFLNSLMRFLESFPPVA